MTSAPMMRRSLRKRRPSVVGVLGELLLTAGVIVLLFVGWQLWIGDIIYGAIGNAAGQERLEQWDAAGPSGALTPTGASEPAETPEPVDSEAPAPDVPDVPPPAPVKAPIMPEPGDTEVFAVMQIPRFGDDYMIEMAGGVTRSGTLDKTRIGHYPGTEMPGEPGNFALAAHRTTFGAPFGRIAELRLNDALVITTKQGWYIYRFRTLEYVTPTETDVLLDVPQKPEIPANGERYITLTSCSPKGSLAERIVAYGVFDSFTPRTAGAPEVLGQA